MTSLTIRIKSNNVHRTAGIDAAGDIELADLDFLKELLVLINAYNKREVEKA